MIKKYPAEELKLISLYKEKNKSSTTRLIEDIMDGKENNSDISKLIDPHEVVLLKFHLEGKTANDLFGYNSITINQSLGENLINNIEEDKLIKLIDHRWVGNSNNDNNLLIIMLQRNKIKLIEKTIDCYLNYSILKHTNDSYQNLNTTLINKFFENIKYPLKNSRENIFWEQEKKFDLEHLLSIAIKYGEKRLKLNNKSTDKLTINEKLNAASTNIYTFLDIAIQLDDVSFFKKLFKEIPAEDRSLYLNYNKNTVKEHKHIFLNKSELHTNLIENMIFSGSYNILNFLKNKNFDFNLENTKINAHTYHHSFNFFENNIKDLLAFKLIDNISYFGYISTTSYPDDRSKIKHLNIHNNILNCLRIFNDLQLSKDFLKSDHISKISSNLFLSGEKIFLEDLTKLFPEITEQKKTFYDSSLTLLETQIVISLFQKYVKLKNHKITETTNERILLHFANITDLMVTSKDIEGKNYNVNAVYKSLKKLFKMAELNHQEIEQIMLEDQLPKTNTPNKKMKI